MTIADASTPMVGEERHGLPPNYGLLFRNQGSPPPDGRYHGCRWENVIVGGSSSLTMMYDTLMRGMVFGMLHSPKPWAACPDRKFLCLVPGYDRHFAITQDLGFELVAVPLTETGPDMDRVEELVKDPSVKGIWCVPKYSKPSGISVPAMRRCAVWPLWRQRPRTYAHPVGTMPMASITSTPMPRMIWRISLHWPGNTAMRDRVIAFASTSKVTYPGAGIAALAASSANLDYIASHMTPSDHRRRQAQYAAPCAVPAGS